MKAKHKRFIGALMALAVALAAVGAVTAAPGSIDGTPPADTTTTVYMGADKTIQTNFTANGSINYALPILNATGASADDLAMNVSKGGATYYTFTGTWNSYNSGESDTSTDYIHNVSGADLADVPMNINENVTLNVTYWNESASSPTPTTIQVYVENGDERSVQRVEDGAATTTVETVSPPAYRPFAEDYDVASVDDTVKVNGSATDVIYTLSTSNVSSPFANATEDLSSQGSFALVQADVDAAETTEVPVFYKSSPDWYKPADHGTYAVYDPTADSLTFHTQDTEFKGVTQGDISFTSDVYRVADIYTVWKTAGGYSGAGVDAVLNMVM